MTKLKVLYRKMTDNSTLCEFPDIDLPPGSSWDPPAPGLCDPNDANHTPWLPLFWTITGPGNGVTSGPTATAHIQSEDVTATCWYYDATVGTYSDPAVSVWAFSLSQNCFLYLCPIESFVPVGAPGQAGTPYVATPGPFWGVSTKTDGVQITPRDSLEDQALHFHQFKFWKVWGLATDDGYILTANQGQGVTAVAFYKQANIGRIELGALEEWDPLKPVIRGPITAEALLPRLRAMTPADLRQTLAGIQKQTNVLAKVVQIIQAEVGRRGRE